MSTATGFSINSFDVYNSELVSRNYTTLVKMESELSLSLSFVHKRLVNTGTLVNDPVCLVLNCSFFFFRERLIVCDIQMCDFSCFLGTILPNMWAKNLSAWCEHDMSSSMMGLELLSSIRVDDNANLLALEQLNVPLEWSIECMKNNLTNLDSINNIVLTSASLDLDDSIVVLLSSWSWINSRLV